MGQNLEKCIKARLVAVQDGLYKQYVFEDLLTFGNFIMCTRCPNWSGGEVQMMQEGFLSFKDVEAGKDSYFNASTGTYHPYQYTATYFLNFVPITHVLNGNTVTKKDKLIIS